MVGYLEVITQVEQVVNYYHLDIGTPSTILYKLILLLVIMNFELLHGVIPKQLDRISTYILPVSEYRFVGFRKYKQHTNSHQRAKSVEGNELHSHLMCACACGAVHHVRWFHRDGVCVCVCVCVLLSIYTHN